jgi:Zn-dependent alcohol dehydrogenase
VLSGEDSISVEDVEVDDPHAGEIGIRVVASGICHSDLHMFERATAGMDPFVMGHEASGIVEKVGHGVDDFVVGDHVVMTVYPQCGVCLYCRGGLPTQCVQGVLSSAGTMQDGTTRVRLQGADVRQAAGMGGWNEHTVVPATAAVKIDPAMPLVPAALIGCGVVTGFGAAANVAHVGRGDSVAVIGCGGLGLSAIQACRIAQAWRIIAIDVVPGKLSLARQFGATDCIDSSTTDVVEAVMELTGGLGVVSAMDFVAIPATARQAIAMTRRGGQTVFTGLGSPELPVDITELVRKAKVVRGNLMGMGRFRDEFAKLVRLYLEGDLMLDEMVSTRIRMDQVRDAFDAMKSGEVARTVIEIDTAGGV